jgi:hypothetical protein
MPKNETKKGGGGTKRVKRAEKRKMIPGKNIKKPKNVKKPQKYKKREGSARIPLSPETPRQGRQAPATPSEPAGPARHRRPKASGTAKSAAGFAFEVLNWGARETRLRKDRDSRGAGFAGSSPEWLSKGGLFERTSVTGVGNGLT